MSSGWFSACDWCDSGSYQLTAGAGEALVWLMSLVPGNCVSAASIASSKSLFYVFVF